MALNLEQDIPGNEILMIRNMKANLIFVVLLAFLTASCQKIIFNTEESTKEINFVDFHAVKFSGIYNIVLIQDSTNRLVITGKNDINSIDAIVKYDTLIIDNHSKISFNPYRNTLALHVKNLNFMQTNDPVNLSNTGTLVADNFFLVAIGEIAEVRLKVECKSLTVVNSANTLGYFNIKGTTDYCSFFNRYGAAVFADSLYCRDAEITNESIGDVHINASRSIRAYIRGPGNIYYYGAPVIDVAEKRGSGSLIRIY